MIHIDRNRIPVPSILAPDPDSARGREVAKALKFYSIGPREDRFQFKVYMHDEVKNALNQLFYSKCAFCERKLTAFEDIEHFRPKQAIEERPDHPGYWWLAAEWKNLYSICIDCNRRHRAKDATGDLIIFGKGTQFPLMDENKRASTPGEETLEEPLLLDPCTDYPAEHLVFDEDSGTVGSETFRGQTTIKVFGLNRKSLVEARKDAAWNIKRLIKTITTLNNILSKLDEGAGADIYGELEARLKDLVHLMEPQQEYAGLKRQIIGTYIDQISADISQIEQVQDIEVKEGEIIDEIESDIKETRQVKAEPTRQKEAQRSYIEFEQSFVEYSLEDEEGKETHRFQSPLIERIELHNIKAFHDLKIDITKPLSGRTPWMMFLGENATGKSTILQSIALTLAGADYFKKLVRNYSIRPSDFIRNRCKSGYVKVYLRGFPEPHTLSFHKSFVTFENPAGKSSKISFEGEKVSLREGKHWSPQFVLLGYGATRLLPRGKRSKSYGGKFARVDNLFHPFVPLLDAKQWLIDLWEADKEKFKKIEKVLKELLALRAQDKIFCKGQDVKVTAHGTTVSLEQLSDGYQSVVALTIDILEVAERVWGDFPIAKGIVLLDEAGSHLHPTWKMRIVSSLRTALPGVQFITSTHQPLCLRGMKEDEVAVMRRDNQSRIMTITGLPSPSDFRVDQLLTSDFFGLSSTIDPEVERIFNEYYMLLSYKEPTAEEEDRIEVLKNELRDRRHLGNTFREELMYEALDKILAKKKNFELELEVSEIKQEAVDQLTEIWSRPLIGEGKDT